VFLFAPSSICFLIIERGLWDWHDRVGMGILEVSFRLIWSKWRKGRNNALNRTKKLIWSRKHVQSIY
jgi:hypothetical protein